MPRVKTGPTKRARHKKILKLARGYWGRKSKIFKVANETVMKALFYARRDRRAKKRNFRRLWIARINAAARMNGISYSRFMNGLKQAGVTVNRKMLADLAVRDRDAFNRFVEMAKSVEKVAE
ncbi:MAG TPA: 50S ribosomal protein L20 [Clostridia bacterium]|nr:50S ribosomal protein L20 [Clostridia bacterium]